MEGYARLMLKQYKHLFVEVKVVNVQHNFVGMMAAYNYLTSKKSLPLHPYCHEVA